jgi:tetratricopeptide (TPR) repeat protein
MHAAAGARANTVGFGHGVSWYDYLYSQGWAIGRYLQLSIIPSGLTIDYGVDPTTGLSPLPGLAAVLALGALTIAAWMRAERWGWLAFLGSWFFVLLAPSSSIVPIASEIAAERRIYLALAAVIVGVVVLVRSRLGTAGRAGGVVTAIVFMAFAALTYRRSAEYAEPERLWHEAIDRVPDNARAYNSLAYTLLHASSPRIDEAIPYLQRAIALDSTALEPLRSLAAIELSRGQFPIARDLLQRAYAIDPNYADVAPLLGVVLAASGEREKAIQYLADPKIDRLVENDPSGSLVVALGNAYMSFGRWDDALTVFSRAIESWPNRADCHFSAGDALTRLGRPADAVPRIQRGLEIDPESALGYALLSQASAGVGRADDAVNAAQLAFQKAPADASILLMLGQAMLTLGRPADAEGFLRDALRLDPGDPQVATALAIAMNGVGQRAAAIALLERVIAAVPSFEPARAALGTMRRTTSP